MKNINTKFNLGNMVMFESIIYEIVGIVISIYYTPNSTRNIKEIKYKLYRTTKINNIQNTETIIGNEEDLEFVRGN